MFRGAVGRVVGGAGAAAAGSALASSPTFTECKTPRVKDVDARAKTNLEISHELSKLSQGDDTWLLAERYGGSIGREEVNQTLEQIVNLGSGFGGDSLLLHEVKCYDSDSAESIGNEADELIEAAERPVVRRVPEQVPAMVYELLRDPGVQRECFRVLQDSASFREMFTRGPLTLPPPPTNVYVRPGAFNVQSHPLLDSNVETGKARDGSDDGPFVAFFDAVAAGLDVIGKGFGELAGKISGFFSGLGNSIRNSLHPKLHSQDSHSPKDAWIGSIFTLACAVFAMIVLKRAARFA